MGKWRKWILGCLASASLSILINGRPTSEFSMGKGIRQGDPLSPFLFIIAVEAIDVIMREDTEKRIFKCAKEWSVGNSINF